MKLKNTEAAVVYTFESDNGETVYRITCVDGIVDSIMKAEIQYYDDGDAENGPRLSSSLSDPVSFETSNVVFEYELKDSERIEAIIKDAEAYTIHLMMSEADYSKM